MRFLILAFKSRNSLYSFNKLLRQYNINTMIINTPRSVSISCGLSIKADYRELGMIKTILQQSNVDGFLGMFTINRAGGFEQVERII